MSDSADPTPNARGAEVLRAHLDTWLRLLEERDEIDAQIRATKTDLKEAGFSPQALKILVERRREEDDRREARQAREALAEVYAATLGIDLDGRGGLSERARRAIQAARRDAETAPGPGSAGADFDQPSLPGAGPAETGPTPDDVEAAARRGAEDFSAGLPVTANPYPAGDPRRPAWDQAWCLAAGTDGMDIPAHLRRPERGKRQPAPLPPAPAGDPADAETDAPDDDAAAEPDAEEDAA